MIKTAALCFIVWSSGFNGNPQEKFDHENAHCWGWEHPTKASTFGQAFSVPDRYKRLGEYPNWTSPCGKKPCSMTKAKKLCGGHFACQWFEGE